MEKGLSYCPKCNETKDINEFFKDIHTAFGIAIYCKKCSSERKKLRYKRHKSEHQDYRLKKDFGITLQEYNELFEKQGQRCCICGKENKSGKRFPVDHCHTTLKIRGILCDQCNNGLGLFYDNPTFLESAIKYLNKSTIK
jgi:hypothetical protein